MDKAEKNRVLDTLIESAESDLFRAQVELDVAKAQKNEQAIQIHEENVNNITIRITTLKSKITSAS